MTNHQDALRMALKKAIFAIPDEHLISRDIIIHAMESSLSALPADVSMQATGQLGSGRMPKLTLALPDYEERRIVIVSDEMLDDERLVCVAIDDSGNGLTPTTYGAAPQDAQELDEFEALEMKYGMMKKAYETEIAHLRKKLDIGELTSRMRALAEKWTKDAIADGFAGSEPANELFDVLDAAIAASAQSAGGKEGV